MIDGILSRKAHRYERGVLRELRRLLLNKDLEWGPQGRRINVLAVLLDKTETENSFVVLLRASDRPECLFGFRFEYDVPPVWVRVASPGDIAKLLKVLLMEQVQAPHLGLPTDCSPQRITWIRGNSGRLMIGFPFFYGGLRV